MITVTTREPVYACDVTAVTGLDATAISRRFRAARGVAPIWPADPFAVASALLDDGETVAGIVPFVTKDATEKLAALLVAERSRRQRENDDRLEQGWRDTAGIVAKGRAVGLDAVGDATAAACRVEHATAEALGAAAEVDVPLMALKGGAK